MPVTEESFDAVVIGSGPNGLAAAVQLARSGASVLVLEGADSIGGSTQTKELTLPGFHHDCGSAAHTMGVLSPFFSQLPLADHGLEWIRGGASVAHPLEGQPAVMLWRSVARTSQALGRDAASYRRLVEPFLEDPHALLRDGLGPLRWPERPVQFARFGLTGLWPSSWLGRAVFREESARALFAGCASHSVLPLSQPLTSAMALMFLIAGHLEEWPVARGGSIAITRSLAAYLRSLGGEIRTGSFVRSARDLPPARVYLFDTDPRQLVSIAGDAIPSSYARRLGRYRYGPGVFKLDWALDGPIPWTDPTCLQASTVHVSGTAAETAESEATMWRGREAERPFLIVVQQSQLDSTRAPAGKHTGYAYCHVPPGSTFDMTERIEAQMERFAPGFRDLILARHTMTPADLERTNPNCVGGAITGGVADWAQFFTRPVVSLDPYATPNPRVYLCSGSTPPGGGVHGMCGYHAAQSALRRLEKIETAPFA